VRRAAERYEETLRALADRGLDRNVSLKLTQMGLDISSEVVSRDGRPRHARGGALGAFVRIDMEEHSKDRFEPSHLARAAPDQPRTAS